ncbi:MAG: cob(I)yrinic acid a,c-diamide adenosyltransferase [Myxococcota bacterium]
MTFRIYTRTGDDGETALFGGDRVSKDHLRVEAYGTVDELNAALGVARAADSLSVDDELAVIQSTLFEVGADLATPPSVEKRPSELTEQDIAWVEQLIDRCEAELEPLKSFVLPAGSPAGAALHLARTVCRRAERRLVSLRASEPATSELALQYLNRVGDLLFVLARRANQEAGVGDVPWRPRSKI